MVTCARELRQRPQLFASYKAERGAEFLAKDLEAQAAETRTSYGIRSHFLHSVTKNVPGQTKDALRSSLPGSDLSAGSSAPSQHLSTQKALWFPVLKVFTHLILNGQEAIRHEALVCLEKTLSEHHDYLSTLLWREILCQLLWPALEALRHDLEQLHPRNQSSTPRATLRRLLECFNHLFTDPSTRAKMSGLATSYSDILCLFASKLEHQDLADDVMNQLRNLVQGMAAPASTAQQWSEVIEQLSFLFQLTKPHLLLDEMQHFQTQQMPELMTISKNKIRGSVKDKRKQNELSQAQCTIQLELTKIIGVIVQNSFELLELEQTSTLLQCLDSVYKFAKEFNSELQLRLRLWKAGFYAESD